MADQKQTSQMMEKRRNDCDIEKDNLLSVLKLVSDETIEANKSKAERLDDDFNPMQQLFTILEHIFLFSLKGGDKDLYTLLERVQDFCPDAAEITVKVNEGHVKTEMGKARAWLRLAMMQKKLADYVNVLLEKKEVLREFYEEGAILLEEDSSTLYNIIDQLNCLDIHFSIDDSAALDAPVGSIDYSLYLNKVPSPDPNTNHTESDSGAADLTLALDQTRIPEKCDTQVTAPSNDTVQLQEENKALQQQVKDLRAENYQLKSKVVRIQSICVEDIQVGHNHKTSDDVCDHTLSGNPNIPGDMSKSTGVVSRATPITQAPMPSQHINNVSSSSHFTTNTLRQEFKDDLNSADSHDLAEQDWSLISEAPADTEADTYFNSIMFCGRRAAAAFTQTFFREMSRQPAVQAGVSGETTSQTVGSSSRSQETQTDDCVIVKVPESTPSNVAINSFSKDVSTNQQAGQTNDGVYPPPEVQGCNNLNANMEEPLATGVSPPTKPNECGAIQTDKQTVNEVSPQVKARGDNSTKTSSQTGEIVYDTDFTAKVTNNVEPIINQSFDSSTTCVAKLQDQCQASAEPSLMAIFLSLVKNGTLTGETSNDTLLETIKKLPSSSIAGGDSSAASNAEPISNADAHARLMTFLSGEREKSSNINTDNKILKQTVKCDESQGVRTSTMCSEGDVFYSLPPSEDFLSISSTTSDAPADPCCDDRDGKKEETVVNIAEYVAREWRGTTSKAQQIKEGYASVMGEHNFKRLVRIRGDNYCALRATFASVVLNNVPLDLPLDKTLQRLQSMNEADPSLLQSWVFPDFMQDVNPKNIYDELFEFLRFGISLIHALTKTEDHKEKVVELDKVLNTGESNEVYILEGMKLLMLLSAHELHKKCTSGQEVPVFAWLFFARDTSETPALFLKNHLNSVGRDSGLEQVEVCLLGYALGVTLKTFRLYQHGEADFIALYPEDGNPKALVPIIAEDDRHYNTLLLPDVFE